jgi:hypothetical protein
MKNPVVREPTKAELQEKVALVDYDISLLMAEKAKLEAEIAKPLTVEVKGGK